MMPDKQKAKDEKEPGRKKGAVLHSFAAFSGQIRLHGTLPFLLFDGVMENSAETVRLAITANERSLIANDDTNLGAVLANHAVEVAGVLLELDGLMNSPVVYAATEWNTFKTEIEGIIQQ